MKQQTNVWEVVNPLMTLETYYIPDWKKWKELWHRPICSEFRHSLLHFGFDIEAYQEEEVERLCLYFDIADGHRSVGWGWDLPKEIDRRYDMNLRTVFGREVDGFGKIRRIIAEKAFHILCQRFFKNTSKEEDIPSWAYLVANPVVLQKIIWFFRLDGKSIVNLPHLSGNDKHFAEIAEKFIYDICVMSWECEGFYSSGDWRSLKEDSLETFRKFRPNMVDLLYGIEKLDVLIKLDKRFKVDEACMKRLEELAMSEDLYLPSEDSWGNSFKKPRDLEEACCGGSQAARVLLILKSNQKVRGRLNKLQENAMKIKELQEKQKKL